MHRPKDVADRLNISAATLRLWSNNFAEVLSPAAQKATTESGTAAQRRYTDQDLAVFRRAKELLGAGHTYERTLELLKQDPPEAREATPVEVPGANGHQPSDPPTLSLVPSIEEHPVFVAFREAIAAKDETIRQLEARVGEVAANKDQTIAALQQQIAELRQHPAPVALPPAVRFRWGFLNRLLLDTGTHGDRG